MPLLAEIIAAMDDWYPPATAESWDRVGLTCGDPNERVSRVLLAVDCLPATVTEASRLDAQLLLTHHPLLLSGVHSVAADQPKGALLHRMIRSGIAHFAAHTNADVATDGVSAALADALGLRDARPLVADPSPGVDQLAVFVPADAAPRLLEALAQAGAGAIGNYDRCSFSIEGVGTYRPLAGAEPFAGTVGEITRTDEVRLSMVLPRDRRRAVLDAMRSNHPYEEVAFELSEQPRLAAPTGSGRLGVLTEPRTLADFTADVARALPRTEVGVRAAGDPARSIRTVAVCGGSGGSYIEQARAAGADAYVTADLKHHTALDAVHEVAGLADRPTMALLDATHYATEAVWLPVLARKLTERFGGDLDVVISAVVTDPWQMHEH